MAIEIHWIRDDQSLAEHCRDWHQLPFVAVDTDCLAKLSDAPLSQDNLFHSMLGLLQVRTEVYQQSLDMFASCRPWLAAKR